MERPAVVLEARREVGDLDDRPRLVVQARHHDRGVLDVALLGPRAPLEVDVEIPALGLVALAVEQAAEEGVAVEVRQAGPHHPPAHVDQRAEAAVADQGEIEVAHRDADLASSSCSLAVSTICAATVASQSRTASGEARR